MMLIRKGSQKWGRIHRPSATHPQPLPPVSAGDAFENAKSSGGESRRGGIRDKCRYRSQLEQEVQKLQKQLQEEIDLHIALTNASGDNTVPLSSSYCNLPDEARELLSSITALESAVSRLEEELISLHFRLSQERNERHFAEYHLMQSPALSHSSAPCSLGCSWEQQLSPLGVLPWGQTPKSSEPDVFPDHGHSPFKTFNGDLVCCKRPDVSLEDEQVSASGNTTTEEKEEVGSPSVQAEIVDELNSNCMARNLWHHPNKLSEEMVRCMRNIFLCLSESSTLSSKNSIHHPPSPVGHLPCSSLTSFSGSSIMPSPVPSPSSELHHHCGDIASKSTLDPYGVNGKESQTDIGVYSSAAEVSWMTVGKKQLEYAAEALKRFRFLVEQLAKVNPANMSCNERLAFWINLYNALIMHAYLAYGVPRSEMKLFALMQKASYTVGGHSFSAADIEYVILKMKPPAHRPQIALVLALHKFKISEEHRKYSTDNSEPLVVFSLSCGMFSSPAVRIFTADNVSEELQNSLRDYVRASVGINDKGKLLVPKLLHCFAKSVVEDSLLVDWICRFLSPEQVSIVRDSASQRKQRLLGARSFSILPFDSRFRYLFLPDNESSSKYS